MKLSYIINTCAADPFARSSRRRSHSERGIILSERIIPAAKNADEVIVAGQWREPNNGDRYLYESVAPLRRDRRDALYQREAGARRSTGDVLVFGHDDHCLGDGFALTLKHDWLDAEWDILVPKRLHGVTQAVLDNGQERDYMGGHVLVMRRWLWARIPWTCIDTEWWDTTLTRIWRNAGAKIVWTDDLSCYDLEAHEDES